MQIVGYTPSNPTITPPQPAVLLTADQSGTVEELVLEPGASLEYTLSNRHCVGATTESGQHMPCTNPTAPYCSKHQDYWLCAICRGDCSKPNDSCEETHAIYLAAFAPRIFKVGVTREWRLNTRLTEQGAHQAVHLATVSDGRIARRQERELSNSTNLREQVQTNLKQDGLHQTVDQDAWQALLAQHDPISEFTFDYNLNLTTKPLIDVLLTGTVVGTQGRVLVLEENDTQYSVDMRELLGQELTEEPDTDARQASFGAF